MGKSFASGVIWLGLAGLLAAPVLAQVQSVDPETVIDADLGPAPGVKPTPPKASGDVF